MSDITDLATTLAASSTAIQRLAEQRARTVEIVQSASVMLVAMLDGFVAYFLSGRKRTDVTTITK